MRALLRPDGRVPRYARANRARCARALRYAPRESVLRVCGGLPPLRGSRGAVALVPRKVGNLPPQSILYPFDAIFTRLHLRAAYGLAACRRYAPPLKIKNKC